MATTSDRMQIPEYVRRELSEVYLLMDHIAGRQDKKLDEALSPPTTGGELITLERLCGVAWPPPDHNRARVLALVLTAKDRLSRAAFPATAYSIAFTYLSIAPHPGAATHGLCERILGRIRQSLARGHQGPGKSGQGPPADGAGGSDTSTMAQFAADAYPGIETKRGWVARTVLLLGCALLALLAVTCAVSWDLAVGQRLLADYRWLSLHPDVLQIDAAQMEKCSALLPDAAPPAAPKPPPPSAPDGGKPPPDPPGVSAGGACARVLAFDRVGQMMQTWSSRQTALRWFIEDGSASNPGLSVEGYVLEMTRVLVTTLNYNVLPMVLGALAAVAAALRAITRKVAGNELEPRDLIQVPSRVLLGAFLGAVIGLLISPGASNGLFSLLGTPETTDTVALSPAAFGFLAGFATSRIFQWLDNLIERIFVSVTPKP
jgi:hypothetical protein